MTRTFPGTSPFNSRLMDEAIDVLSKSLGPKWTHLFHRLAIGDYRTRFQIHSKWNQKEPTDDNARNYKCSLDVLQRWRLSMQQGKQVDESVLLEQLLNTVNQVKGLQRIANELAQRNGKKNNS